MTKAKPFALNEALRIFGLWPNLAESGRMEEE